MNKFEIQIVALDRFSKQFQKLKNDAAQSLQPLVRSQRSVAALSRVMNLPQLGRGIQNAASAAGLFAQNLGLATGPIGALTRGGVLVGVAALSAALVALTARWASLGFNVATTSRSLGMSTDQFQRLQGVAKLSNVPVESMVDALGELQARMRLIDNQDPGANTMMSLLAKNLVQIRRNKDGLFDLTAFLEDLSRVTQRLGDPSKQRAFAEAFGLGPLISILREGPEAVRKLGDAFESLGGKQAKPALDWAVKFTDSLNRMRVALDGVANSLGVMFGPGMTRLMDALTDRVSGKKSWLTFGYSTEGLSSGMDAWKNKLLYGTPLFGDKPNQRRVSGVVPGSDVGFGSGAPGEGSGSATAAAESELRDWAERRNQRNTGSSANVNVIVSVPNAPAGTTVRASSDSASAPVRVQRGLPQGGLP